MKLSTSWFFLQEKRPFFISLAFILGGYCVLSVYYVFFARFTMDDFWLFYHNQHFQSALPYRDFLPYKTVLGYYFLLPPVALFHGLIYPLIYTKIYLIFLNLGFLVLVSLWARKFFKPLAILASLFILVFSAVFLRYSVEIRVDILAFWLCLLACLALLEEKYLLAGLSMGLAFMMCQKAMYYILATNVGLFAWWWKHGWEGRRFKVMLRYNAMIFLLVLAYLMLWSYVATPAIVLRSVFYEPYLLMQVDWYYPYVLVMWNIIWTNNQGLLLLVSLALFSLLLSWRQWDDQQLFIVLITFVVLLPLIFSKQPFAYLLTAALPVFYLLLAAFFSSMNDAYFNAEALCSRVSLWLFCLLYAVVLLCLDNYFNLSPWLYCSAVLPLVLCFFYKRHLDKMDLKIAYVLVFASFFSLGFIFPALNFVEWLGKSNGSYQRSMLQLMQSLLHDGGRYIAGSPLLPDIEQPVSGLVHLTSPVLSYLQEPSEKLRPIANLSSLYHSSNTASQIVASLKKAPIKLYVSNRVIRRLPQRIQDYLDSEFQVFWGSIFLYAPQILAGPHAMQLKFSGDYKVRAKPSASIRLNGRKIDALSTLYLPAGIYQSDAKSKYRLILLPQHVEHLLQASTKANRWREVLADW